jgi:metallo-beta-lactamase class B
VSAATVAASASGAFAIEHGGPPADDPQYAFGHEANDFPRVKRVRVVKDGETLRVGDLAITAHTTPGHTPGSTTKLRRRAEQPASDALVDPEGCRTYAAGARQRLDQRLAEERRQP